MLCIRKLANNVQTSKLFCVLTLVVLGLAFCRAFYDCIVASPTLLVHNKKAERLLWKQFKQLTAVHVAPILLANQLEKLGIFYSENGHFKQANYVFLEALAYSLSAGDSATIRKSLRLLAEENRDAEHYDMARHFYLRLINIDAQEHRPTDTVFDTNYLAMNSYLAGCSSRSNVEAKRLFNDAETHYKSAMHLVDSISPPPKDMKLLVTNSYVQLLIEENRFAELAKFCTVIPNRRME